jgi:hypothetical protein
VELEPPPAGDFRGHQEEELVGDFKNGGRELRPKGQPEQVRVHDFIDPELGRATPYGIYDLGRNSGWVSVGMDHDPPLVAHHGTTSLSGSHSTADHCRRG